MLTSGWRRVAARQLRIDGAVHVATVKADAGSIELPPDPDAALWLRDGPAEHASIASFSRAALELMALGAPLELVEAWRIVMWACEAGGEGVARLLLDLAGKVGEAPLDGFLTPARFREVERSVLRDVVGPAATACAQPVA